MNLNAIVAGNIGAVNQNIPVSLQVSTGYTDNPDMSRTPTYAQVGGASFVGSISGNVLTVTQVMNGALGASMTVMGTGVQALTMITGQLSGSAGGTGSYGVSISQAVISGVLAASGVYGQVQELNFRDLQHLEALNLNKGGRKIYLNGVANAIVRVNRKGGDLITLPNGDVYLTTAILELWNQPDPGWVSVAVTLQNGS